MTSTAVPPEPPHQSPLASPARDVTPRPLGQQIAAVMAVHGLSKPDAEAYVDRHGRGAVAIELRRYWQEWSG